jgi:AcrR family transcriptional regulator
MVDRGSITRQRILDAAIDVLAEKGLARTSIREVARRAKVATGLAYYHFRTKAALLEAVIQTSRARFMREIEVRPPSGNGPEVTRQILELTSALPDFMPDWFRLNIDVDALGLREKHFRAAATDNKRSGEQTVRFYLGVSAGSFGAPALSNLDPLAAVLLAAFDGLGVRKLLDPSFDFAGAYVELEALVLARLAPGSTPPERRWNPDPLGLSKRRKRVPKTSRPAKRKSSR